MSCGCKHCAEAKKETDKGSSSQKSNHVDSQVTPDHGAGNLTTQHAPSHASARVGEDNQATLRRLGVQTKLNVNEPGDAYEQEANRVANQVMSRVGSPPSIQRCACEEEVQRKETGDGPTGRSAESKVNAVSGGGQSLSSETRSFFEPRFGRTLDHVRVHTGAQAESAASAVNARAYTRGNDIVFGAGQYQPDTTNGKLLLAHEITHTIQQTGQGDALGIQRTIGDGHDLTSPRFSGNSTLEACFDNEQLLIIGSAGPAVRLVQQALVDAGHPLPVFGVDGVYGDETAAAVRSFQTREGLTGRDVDGIVGPITMGLLDNKFPGGPTPPGPTPPAPTPPPPPPAPACGLTITGPNEVDNYCAAYVPSDAASCGVFPAPNITLNATGGRAGSTLTWSITTGGTKASIVGANTGASVVIRGDAPSDPATRGDVTVQVSDGACTATRNITVRRPTTMTETQSPSSSPTVIENIITYTVRDQYAAAMGAGICVDETITICARSVRVTPTFGDAATNASGQVQDHLRISMPDGSPLPPGICILLNQTLTAGGCGPLLTNTILFTNAGIVLTHGASCAAGASCP